LLVVQLSEKCGWQPGQQSGDRRKSSPALA